MLDIFFFKGLLYMVHAFLTPNVGFFCHSDANWTVAEGVESLLAFLDCPPDVFEQTYRSSLLKLITQPKQSLLPDPHVVQAYGIACICSAEKKKERWLVQLDRLPFGLQREDQEVGLFRLAEGTRVVWADEAFYQMVGLSQEEFATTYTNDLSRFDASLSSLPVRTYLHVAQHNLLFCATRSAGYCFPLPASSSLNTYYKAFKANGMRAWQYELETSTLKGVIFSDADLFQLETLHRRLRNGESSCSARFFLEGEKRFVSVQYQREGSIAFAVEQDISSYANKQRFIFFEEHLHEQNLQSLQSVIKADLTDNTVVYLKRNGLESRAVGEVHTLSEVVEAIIGSMTFDEEKQTFRKRFSLDSMLEAEQEGINELLMEFRSSDETGSIHWMEARVLLNRDLNTHHVHALGTSRRITEKKKLELSLAEKPQRDHITNFYDKKTFASMVGLALKMEENHSLPYAFAIIEIQGISLVNQTIFSHIAQIIRLGINDRCIVGRLDSTNFGLFFDKIESCMDAKGRLERLASMLANASVFDAIEQHPTSFTGFVSGSYGDDGSYSSLLEKATLALEKAYEKGKNQVFVHDGEHAHFSSSMLPLNMMDIQAQGVILGHMDKTIRYTDLGSTLPLILSQVGMYYHSKRVCLLTKEPGKELQVAASWEPSTSALFSHSFAFDPFAGLFDKQQVRTVSTFEQHPSIPCFDGSDLLVGNLQIWNLEKSYLVVFDPAHDDSSVLTHAAQLISSEMTKRRMLDHQEYLLYHDNGTGFRNFHGYNQYISTLEGDPISSLGLIIVDINDLKEINRRQGKDFGNKVIMTASRVLRENFPEAVLFRLSSHEFLGVRVDVTYKGFSQMIEALSMQLHTLLPGITTSAHAWSEQEKQVPVLYNQASMELEANRQNSLNLSNLGEHYQAFAELDSSLKRGEYIIHLQPKICCTTGQACGSEALIRHMHPTHGLVSPAKFIPQLEQDGLIRYIDLFVFEEVCKLLSRWQGEGGKPLPVSLNFSRLTLLDTKLISKMEEIRARHGVDSKLVEIEITESFGALDRNLVQRVAQEIVEAGFTLCIDDFGSEYSNLSTLTLLPIKVLKLDKSLIDSVTYSENAQIFVEGFITICKKLAILTVAEGVETEVQKDLLVSMGCDMIQGYFFDKPLALSQFEQKYRAKSCLALSK